MRPQYRPVTCQIVKVVHDDGHKEVNDLWERKDLNHTRCFCYYGYGKHCTEGVKDVMLVEMISQLIYNNTVAYWEGISMSTHQEGAKHIKANKVDDGKVAATDFTGMADL